MSIVDHFTWKDKSGAAGTIGAELGRSLCRKLTSLFCFVARDSNRSVDIFDEKKHPLTVSFVPGENPPPCVCVCLSFPFLCIQTDPDNLVCSVSSRERRFRMTTPAWTQNTSSSTASSARSSARPSSPRSVPLSHWSVTSVRKME